MTLEMVNQFFVVKFHFMQIGYTMLLNPTESESIHYTISGSCTSQVGVRHK